jgi:hypothetical protein
MADYGRKKSAQRAFLSRINDMTMELLVAQKRTMHA